MEPAQINLRLFDLLGKKLANLLNGYQQDGCHN
ncbi:MAG: hypothetical protein AB1394_09610 [Bacteroidota bacterium]